MAVHGQEAEWVRRSCAGDVEAFGHLVERHQVRLLTAVTRSVGRQEVAEDIVQDAFVRAFEAIDRFQGRSSFYTWLYRIAFNLVASRHRRERRAPNPGGPVPVEEMEVVLRLPAGTVKSRIHRARLGLRDKLRGLL